MPAAVPAALPRGGGVAGRPAAGGVAEVTEVMCQCSEESLSLQRDSPSSGYFSLFAGRLRLVSWSGVLYCCVLFVCSIGKLEHVFHIQISFIFIAKSFSS